MKDDDPVIFGATLHLWREQKWFPNSASRDESRFRCECLEQVNRDGRRRRFISYNTTAHVSRMVVKTQRALACMDMKPFDRVLRHDASLKPGAT